MAITNLPQFNGINFLCVILIAAVLLLVTSLVI